MSQEITEWIVIHSLLSWIGSVTFSAKKTSKIRDLDPVSGERRGCRNSAAIVDGLQPGECHDQIEKLPMLCFWLLAQDNIPNRIVL
jgi:hypothetical protein